MPPPGCLLARATRRRAPAGLRERLAGVPVAPAVREVRRLLGELRPAWWVLRGYLVVLVPCLVERDGVPDVPVPAPLDSHALGLVLVVAAVVASVALGRRTLPRPVGALVGAAGVALVLASFVIGEGAWSSVTGPAPMGQAPEVANGEYPLLSRYGPVTDVLPYAADGTPLEGVLLYDQDGRPLHVGLPGVVGGQLRPGAGAASRCRRRPGAELVPAVLRPRPCRCGPEPQHPAAGRQLRGGRAAARRPAADLPRRVDRPCPRRLTGVGRGHPRLVHVTGGFFPSGSGHEPRVNRSAACRERAASR